MDKLSQENHLKHSVMSNKILRHIFSPMQHFLLWALWTVFGSITLIKLTFYRIVLLREQQYLQTLPLSGLSEWPHQTRLRLLFFYAVPIECIGNWPLQKYSLAQLFMQFLHQSNNVLQPSMNSVMITVICSNHKLNTSRHVFSFIHARSPKQHQHSMAYLVCCYSFLRALQTFANLI